MELTLEGDNAHIIKWWVDASYGVHHDMRIHTGGFLTLGKGGTYATSTRQKINTKSSTEAELVGVSDVLPQILWTRYFLIAQGYLTNESIIYQDNKSAILLEKNGTASSSKRTRHINIRYYFVTDRINNGEVIVEYCPTKIMIADFFTKPLQGVLFTTFRNVIMNIDHDSNVCQDHRSVLAERESMTTSSRTEEEGFTPVMYRRTQRMLNKIQEGNKLNEIQQGIENENAEDHRHGNRRGNKES